MALLVVNLKTTTALLKLHYASSSYNQYLIECHTIRIVVAVCITITSEW